MKKKIICVVGKTGRGKDLFSHYLSEKLGYPVVCSYTTRGMRPGEVQDREHHFISPLRMRMLLDEDEVIAYAKKESGVEYCVTDLCLSNNCIYIIDPEGIHYLKDKYNDRYDLFIVELVCPDEVVDERIKKRGDDWNTYKSRLQQEEKEWDDFHNNKEWDVSISSNQPLDNMCNEFLSVFGQE